MCVAISDNNRVIDQKHMALLRVEYPGWSEQWIIREQKAHGFENKTY